MHARIFVEETPLATVTMRSFRHSCPLRFALIVAALGYSSAVAAAVQSVTLNGRLGSKQALLVIDGQPHAVAVGNSVKGVRLLSVSATQADVTIDGERSTLLLGAGPVKVSDPSTARSIQEIVLTAGTGGHFHTVGQINGKSAAFMVDTGATKVSMGQSEAERLGVDYKSGTRGLAETANGRVPVYAVTLNSVRVGDIEVANVEALVLPLPMPHILLGNSFLTRFSMKRENEVMRLEKRPN
jgi:aspartyl protease family protein